MAGVSGAEETEVAETSLFSYDISSLKQGDWVEYASVSGSSAWSSRWACVQVEENVVWIEISTSVADSEVRLLGVSKASNLVLFAYAGKRGEVGRKLKVTERHEMTASIQPGGKQTEREGRKISPDEERKPNPDEEAKCTVSPEKEEISVGEQKFVCEKWTVEYRFGGDAKDKRVDTMWVSDKIPFGRRLDKAGNPMVYGRDLPWEGKRTLNGGSVKESHERPGGTGTRVLKGFGTDAKPTVKMKATEEGEKK